MLPHPRRQSTLPFVLLSVAEAKVFDKEGRWECLDWSPQTESSPLACHPNTMEQSTRPLLSSEWSICASYQKELAQLRIRELEQLRMF